MSRSYSVNTSNDVLLDPNHSHFILVDDGSDGQFGKEIKFRAKFENELRKGRSLKYYETRRQFMQRKQTYNKTENIEDSNEQDHDSGELIPMILIVVNGGPNTLLTVVESLEENTPVLVLAVNNFFRGNFLNLIYDFWFFQ
jgi:hypothetical protein